MTIKSPQEPTESEPLSVDKRLSLLSSRFRRYLLYTLSMYPTPLSLPDVADAVTALEYGTPAGEYPDERLEIYTSLYHHHLPQLVEAGVVRYDQSDDSVCVGPNAGELVSLLELTIAHDRPAENGVAPREPDLDSLS
ncbi:DUF7344 domain-containing protein [Haloarcula salina]|uniref:DUF7344 domain-containing protein n=1 Tax=Haloarcula salina TaxID=1429914 RepID=A0AA41G6H8_9EURY|nr:hypothetical protein [Haloarcula salina]MBV0900997.1 hypothetical protein [Haloarcula salina]